MSKRLGKVWIKVDGDLLESLPNSSIDLGGVTRTPVTGGNKVLGYSETVKEAMIECEIALGPATSLTKLAGIKDAVATFECDTGQTYVVRDAFIVDPPKATAGDGGKVPIKLAGQPAEELGV